jgi:hypothetical protein
VRWERKPHYVVIESQDGKGEKHRMKQWLRDHPEFVPGVDPSDRKITTHKLRDGLVAHGRKPAQTIEGGLQAGLKPRAG